MALPFTHFSTSEGIVIERHQGTSGWEKTQRIAHHMQILTPKTKALFSKHSTFKACKLHLTCVRLFVGLINPLEHVFGHRFRQW